MAEFLHPAIHGLIHGPFEFDFAAGGICYHFASPDGVLLSPDKYTTLIALSPKMIARYSKGIAAGAGRQAGGRRAAIQ